VPEASSQKNWLRAGSQLAFESSEADTVPRDRNAPAASGAPESAYAVVGGPEGLQYTRIDMG
jgi:hypothetical protein